MSPSPRNGSGANPENPALPHTTLKLDHSGDPLVVTNSRAGFLSKSGAAYTAALLNVRRIANALSSTKDAVAAAESAS